MIFDEFQLLIQPDIQNPTQWTISVRKCTNTQLLGNQGSLTSRVTLADLNILRNPGGRPGVPTLRQIGQAVIDSIMTAKVLDGFKDCATQAQNNQRGLRLVISIIGDVIVNGVRLSELPLETAFNTNLGFIANSSQMPISRGISADPDREPIKVPPPLRILLVISEPQDMPPVKGDKEKSAIFSALNQLIDAGAVKIEICNPPTLMQLQNKLRFGYHIVHFIGHGDFDITGIDPTTPQPHLYFEDGTPARNRHAVNSEQIFAILRDGNVPLVVLSACSSAAASPNIPGNYPVIAFNSLAQTLVERTTGPSAVVAMQFDFETEAAEVFSGALYEKLLTPEMTLDAAVASARLSLIGSPKFGSDHRAWVTPTVFWRFKEGRVFDFLDVTGSLSDDQRDQLLRIQTMIEVYEETLSELLNSPQADQNATLEDKQQWQDKIQELLNERGLILGNTVRLRGGIANPDGTIECGLTLQLRLPATIGDVSVIVKHDPNEFDFVDHTPGKDVDPNSVFAQTQNQTFAALIRNASQGVVWMPGEHELAKVKFQLKQPISKPIYYLRLDNPQVNSNGAAQQFMILEAAVFPNN